MVTVTPEEAEAWLERDFRGYGDSPPDPQWPNGAKIAVNFVINHEEGGEKCPEAELGDDEAEVFFTDFGPVGHMKPIPGERDPATESQFEYGTRVGIWRLMRLFDKHAIPVTFYAVAKSFERNLAIPQHVEANGHETCCHGYRWRGYGDASLDLEEEHCRLAIDSLKRTSPSGRVPNGWFLGRPSARSVHVVAKVYEELGHDLLYWADSYADDLPYWKPMPGNPSKGLLIMPYSFDSNDTKMWFGQYSSDDAFAQHVIDGFTTLRDEGLEGRPSYLTVAIHSRWMARPGRFQALKRMVEHMMSFNDVWFATREQIAQHFAARYPYDAAAFASHPYVQLSAGNSSNGHGGKANGKSHRHANGLANGTVNGH